MFQNLLLTLDGRRLEGLEQRSIKTRKSDSKGIVILKTWLLSMVGIDVVLLRAEGDNCDQSSDCQRGGDLDHHPISRTRLSAFRFAKAHRQHVLGT